MRRRALALLLLAALLCGCQPLGPEQTQYNATFLTLFDTVTTIVGRAGSQAAFTQTAQAVHDALLVYHRLFDIYNDYPGLNNLKTVNDAAGQAPVVVDRAIVDLLLDCRDYYDRTCGRVNVAMGGVLRLWHEARTQGLQNPAAAALPDPALLRAAAEHCSWDSVIIDEQSSTVYLADPAMALDVGAVAKGWSAQRVAASSPEGLLISVGGNVCATGPKAQDTPWVVGIQNPDGSEAYLHTIYLSYGSVVTSGDYQRAYAVEGQLYHHIIDPDTLSPGRLWRSVSVVCRDSGLADALSTALFLLPQDQGQALLDRCGAMALWMDPAGKLFYSTGFEAIIRT